MIWWVYQQTLKASSLDDLIVATDDQRIAEACKKYGMKYIMTSPDHDSPTSRMYEVATKMRYDYYVFIGGDEPLIEPDAIDAVTEEAKRTGMDCVNAMTIIKSAPEVIDVTNLKVVTNTKGNLIITTRSPLPYPKGGLDFDYMKFVGIAAYSSKALTLYNEAPKSKLEILEGCDLIRFIDQEIPVRMVEVTCKTVSVDTPKDLEIVRSIIGNQLDRR
jgi:3-deoxy-manno-octulosonate cytidylyltransferase (CMP-KDO synthetase)